MRLFLWNFGAIIMEQCIHFSRAPKNDFELFHQMKNALIIYLKID